MCLWIVRGFCWWNSFRPLLFLNTGWTRIMIVLIQKFVSSCRICCFETALKVLECAPGSSRQRARYIETPWKMLKILLFCSGCTALCSSSGWLGRNLGAGCEHPSCPLGMHSRIGRCCLIHRQIQVSPQFSVCPSILVGPHLGLDRNDRHHQTSIFAAASNKPMHLRVDTAELTGARSSRLFSHL